MAKINVRGATEVARWRNPNSLNEYLLRSDGVVLWKVLHGSWKVVGRKASPESVENVFNLAGRYVRVRR